MIPKELTLGWGDVLAFTLHILDHLLDVFDFLRLLVVSCSVLTICLLLIK